MNSKYTSEQREHKRLLCVIHISYIYFDTYEYEVARRTSTKFEKKTLMEYNSIKDYKT